MMQCFLKQALAGERLGKILQAGAYVKWYRSAEYYAQRARVRGLLRGEAH
jgi:hypothetical protein